MVTHFMWLFFAFTSLAYIHVTCVNFVSFRVTCVVCQFCVFLLCHLMCHHRRCESSVTSTVTGQYQLSEWRDLRHVSHWGQCHHVSSMSSIIACHMLHLCVTSLSYTIVCHISVMSHICQVLSHVTNLSSVITCHTSVKYHHMSYCHVSSYVISLTGDITLSGVITQVSSLSHRCHVSLILVFVIQVFLWMDMTL